MAFDTGGRIYEMAYPFHHSAGPVNVPTNIPSIPNLTVPIPNLPFIPEPMAALMKPVCAVVPNPPPTDRFMVNMPEELYNDMVCEPVLAPGDEDMVTTCCHCGTKNYTWDLKWNKAKIKLKCIDEFMNVLKKQVQFNIIPSPSAPNQPTSIPSGIVCPPPDMYSNLKSNLSATAQEFRPIQNQKPNVHVDETQNVNKDVYTICRVSINNDESSRLPNEPLDTNDSGTLESGIDSGVHDSGVSDSGVTDPAITDSAAERFVPNEDPEMANACNACESDSLKNEKDGKKKAKKKRTKARPQKSNNGSMDNLASDVIEDAEFTNQNSDIYYNKSTLDVGRPQQNDVRATNSTPYRSNKPPRRHTNEPEWPKVPPQKTAWNDSRNGQVDRDHSNFMDAKSNRVPSKTSGTRRNDTNSCEPLGPGKPRDARGPSANRRPTTNNSNNYGSYNNKKFGKPYNNVVHEIDGNLFSAGPEYALAHCVAEDFRMSAGIAMQFKKEFGCVGELLDQRKTVGEVAVLDHSSRCIFYLITKPCSNNKPTFESMKQAIKSLKEECVKRNIKKLAMPRIGCGLDKLNWKYVRDALNDEFGATDVEIVVYNFKEEEENSEGASHSKKPSHQKGPSVYHRASALADIEPSTAVIVYGTLDGHVDKTCETVNLKYPFKDSYLKNCKKGLVGDVLPIGMFGQPFQEYVFVFLTRETASEPYSFKHLETCVKNLNSHLKKFHYIYVGFEYLDDQDDPMFNEKVLTLFRNNIYVRDIEIYACNSKKNEEYASHASQNSNNDSSTYNSNYSRRS